MIVTLFECWAHKLTSLMKSIKNPSKPYLIASIAFYDIRNPGLYCFIKNNTSRFTDIRLIKRFVVFWKYFIDLKVDFLNPFRWFLKTSSYIPVVLDIIFFVLRFRLILFCTFTQSRNYLPTRSSYLCVSEFNLLTRAIKKIKITNIF